MPIPSHINIGAAGFTLIMVSSIPDEVLRQHGLHDAGWNTYGFFELDAFTCSDCHIVYAETLQAATMIREAFKAKES